MVMLPPACPSIAQEETVVAMFRLLKLYRRQKRDMQLRREFAGMLLKLAERLASLPDAGGSWPMPRGYRPGSNPLPEGPRPDAPPNPPPRFP